MKYVCNYSVVRFLPYRETGEFANIGVVAHCPEINYFGFRLPERRSRRVRAFFPELDLAVFEAAVGALKEELTTYRNDEHLFTRGRKTTQEDIAKGRLAFDSLVRRREALLHFGEAGSRIVDDPKAALRELYDHFVLRQFARQPEYRETVMKKRLGEWLTDWNIRKKYKLNGKVGDAEFHVTFPFVHLIGDQVTKVIKPFDLNRAETTEIYEHGGAWIMRVRRLNERGQRPKQLVFAVTMPARDESQKAANEVTADLRELDVDVVPFEQNERLRALVQV